MIRINWIVAALVMASCAVYGYLQGRRDGIEAVFTALDDYFSELRQSTVSNPPSVRDAWCLLIGLLPGSVATLLFWAAFRIAPFSIVIAS